MYVVTRPEWFDIEGLPFATAGWRLADIYPLLRGPQVDRNDDKIPGFDGEDPNPDFAAATTTDLDLLIFGAYNGQGGLWSDPRLGAARNLLTVRTVTDPLSTGDGTRLGTIHLRDGTTLTSRVKTALSDPREGGEKAHYRVTLTVVAMGGSFT